MFEPGRILFFIPAPSTHTPQLLCAHDFCLYTHRSCLDPRGTLMSKPVFGVFGKRTRSQLTLPDDILQVPQHSPLKNAKMMNRGAGLPGARGDGGNMTEDELLPPGKESAETAMLPGKRSASSSADGSSSGDSERQTKRIKRDEGGDEEPSTSNPLHKHSLSDVPPITRAARRRATKNQSNKPPSSSKQLTPQQPNDSTEARIHSIPIFSTNPLVPHLDLRHPPPSPHRSRSRSLSPTKEFEPHIRLKVIPATIVEHVEPTLGNKKLDIPNDVEMRDAQLLPLGGVQDPYTSFVTNPSLPPNGTNPPEFESPSNLPIMLVPLEHTTTEPPISPLTPLPEAPQPSRFRLKGEVRKKYMKGLASDHKIPELEEHVTQVGFNSLLHYSILTDCIFCFQISRSHTKRMLTKVRCILRILDLKLFPMSAKTIH